MNGEHRSGAALSTAVAIAGLFGALVGSVAVAFSYSSRLSRIEVIAESVAREVSDMRQDIRTLYKEKRP